MPATAIPTTIKLADYTVSTLLLTTVDPRETELIFMEKSKVGASWTAVNAMVLDLSGVPTADLREFDYERLRRQAASYGIVLAGVVADRNKERTEHILNGKGRVLSPRISGLAAAKANSVASVDSTTKTANTDNNANAVSASTQATQATLETSKQNQNQDSNQAPATNKQEPEKAESKVVANTQATSASDATAPKVAASETTTQAQTTPSANEAQANTSAANANTNACMVPNDGATLIHYGNIRSGTQLYAQNKSLIIFGNVGDGAEVIADDCVFIFGRALGRVLAGVKSENSIVFCKSFNPQLVSINGVYCTADDLQPKTVDRSVLVRLKDGKLDFEVQDR